MTRWVRMVSWHAIAITYRSGRAGTRCGRMAAQGAPESDVLPLDERSCEVCLRLKARDEEHG